MEHDITLEELHSTVEQLAHNKMLGQDGLPMEFFLLLWDSIGPVLLEVLRARLRLGRLHPQLTHGILVLLAKDGDPLLMSNKRGITLLNCGLKILTKLHQLRLSGILQHFIIEQQSTFLPGRSIHRLVMLTNKVLQKVKKAEEGFLLLKLDTIKAFDCLGWFFLIRLLERIGFGPKFIRMVEAINATTTTLVLIQGRLLAPIPLKRSLRQGCPLSPCFILLLPVHLV